jgi:predicted transposase YdaD
MGILHDSAFRELFAHPESMRELLCSFLSPEWSAQLDLASLERVNGSYAGGEGVQRHSDMVWRVLLAGRWLYLYLLLEFQSSSDHWMALRMRVYCGLLHQDLVKRHELPAAGCLPPILPIVLYTGRKPWRASRSMSSLVMLGLDTRWERLRNG